jgi:hypothetical protein
MFLCLSLMMFWMRESESIIQAIDIRRAADVPEYAELIDWNCFESGNGLDDILTFRFSSATSCFYFLR